MMAQADQDKDGKLSKKELETVADAWFAAWDKEKSGRLSGDQLRDGMNASFTPTNAGPGGFGGGGPPMMNLQGPEGKRNGVAAMMGVDFKQVHASVEIEGQVFKDVAVRYKGNGTFLESRGSIKRSLKVDLNKFDKAQKFAGVTTLNLHNNVTDPSWMNEVLSHRLYRDAKVPAPRTAYARVYVTVPGKYDKKYFGLYSLVEDPGKGRAAEMFGTKGVAVFKPVTPRLFSYLGEDWKAYNQTYDPKTDLAPEHKARVIEFCKLVSNADDAEFARRLGEFVDYDELGRFMAVMVFLSDLDGILGPGQNLYLYLDPKSGRFLFVPWDQDHSFGQFGMRGTQEQRENLSINKPWQGANPFLERVFKVPDFKKAYLASVSEFSKTIFEPSRFAAQVDELAAVLRPSVEEESTEKLERFNKVVGGEMPRPTGFGAFFSQPIKPIKPFTVIRAKSVADQLAGKSEGRVLEEFSFPGMGGPGRGQARVGVGNFAGDTLLTALDTDKDKALSKAEFLGGLGKWFDSWDKEKSGVLTSDQLRDGLNAELSPFRGGPPGGGPGGPGFGFPGGPPPGQQ